MVAAEQETALTERKPATLRAITAPAAILATIGVASIGFFILAKTLPVLSHDTLASIDVGDDRETTEASLPAWEMLDPPRTEAPPGRGETCRYFEMTVSFFERTDVVVICFEGDRVSRVEVVPAP